MFLISERGASALCLSHPAALQGRARTQSLPAQSTPALCDPTGVLGSAGSGLAYVGWLQCLSALCTPAPQLREQEAQALQELQPPSMGSGRNPTGTHSPLKHHCRAEGNRAQGWAQLGPSTQTGPGKSLLCWHGGAWGQLGSARAGSSSSHGKPKGVGLFEGLREKTNPKLHGDPSARGSTAQCQPRGASPAVGKIPDRSIHHGSRRSHVLSCHRY